MSGRPQTHGSRPSRGGRGGNNGSSRGRGSTNAGRGGGVTGRNGQSAGSGPSGDMRRGSPANTSAPRISREAIELVAQHSKLKKFLQFFHFPNFKS